MTEGDIPFCECGRRAHHELTVGVVMIQEEMIEQVELHCGAPACKDRIISRSELV